MKLKMMGTVLVAVILLVMAANPAFAALNARSLGMGGAYIAVANDAAAGHLNPAALPFLSEPQCSFFYGAAAISHIALAEPVATILPYSWYDVGYTSYPHLDYASPTSDSGLAYGLFAYRTELLSFPPFTNEVNTSDGNIYAESVGQDTVVGYSLAAELFPGLSVGGTIRVGYYQTDRPYNAGDDGHVVSAEYSFLHVGIDAGVLYRPVPQFALGLVVTDINQAELVFEPTGSEHATQGLQDAITGEIIDNWSIRFPCLFRWGAAFSIPKFLTIAWDMVALPQSIDEILLVSEFGAEWQINPILAFRGGMYHSIFTAGVGITLHFGDTSGLRLDYAYLANTEGQHFLSASWLF